MSDDDTTNRVRKQLSTCTLFQVLRVEYLRADGYETQQSHIQTFVDENPNVFLGPAKPFVMKRLDRGIWLSYGWSDDQEARVVGAILLRRFKGVSVLESISVDPLFNQLMPEYLRRLMAWLSAHVADLWRADSDPEIVDLGEGRYIVIAEPDTSVPCSVEERDLWYRYKFICDRFSKKTSFTHKNLGAAIGLSDGTTRHKYSDWQTGTSVEEILQSFLLT